MITSQKLAHRLQAEEWYERGVLKNRESFKIKFHEKENWPAEEYEVKEQ